MLLHGGPPFLVQPDRRSGGGPPSIFHRPVGHPGREGGNQGTPNPPKPGPLRSPFCHWSRYSVSFLATCEKRRRRGVIREWVRVGGCRVRVHHCAQGQKQVLI